MIDQKSILIVDDDKGLREALTKTLTKEGYIVHAVEDGEVALAFLRQLRAHTLTSERDKAALDGGNVNLILTDMVMPKMDGVQLLKAAKTIFPEIEVVLMTAYGTVDTAVEAMKEGAYDYIEKKPLRPIEVKTVIARALEKQVLVLENKSLKSQLDANYSFENIIGRSNAMRRVLERVQQIAPSSATVLITGESGTGKELIAEAIHYASPRKDKPLIKVNCAALPETLLESELFGYDRGAFTGATGRKTGRFEWADGGTLFLDEIGDMPLPVQVKLLRVLQDGEFERLGGQSTIKVDVRIIVATAKDLAKEAETGNFREELFYRLNVIPIYLSPLRERPDDIPLLVNHFLEIYRKKNNKDILGISNDALEILCNYPWRGNVRELKNAIEQAVVLSKGNSITTEDLPPHIYERHSRQKSNIVVPLGTPLEEIQRQVIFETLKRTKGDKELAAKLLGISSRTIYRKLNPTEDKGNPLEEN